MNHREDGEFGEGATMLAVPGEGHTTMELLLIAQIALGEYACHIGDKHPCRRTGDQCSASCGKTAGDAALLIEAAEINHVLKDTPKPEFDDFNVAKLASPQPPTPAGVREITDGEVLAGCRVLHPSIFSRGMEPMPSDGPATRAMISEDIRKVRAILEAAAKGAGE